MIGKINNLITYLEWKPSISAIASNRLYLWNTPNSSETGIYAIFNMITAQNPSEVEKKYRLEIRCIWHNENVTYSQLSALEQAIENELLNYKNDEVWKITIQNKANWFDEMKRRVLVSDYMVFYTY